MNEHFSPRPLTLLEGEGKNAEGDREEGGWFQILEMRSRVVVRPRRPGFFPGQGTHDAATLEILMCRNGRLLNNQEKSSLRQTVRGPGPLRPIESMEWSSQPDSRVTSPNGCRGNQPESCKAGL